MKFKIHAGVPEGHNTLDLQGMKQAALMGTVMASFSVEAFGTSELEVLTSPRIQERLRIFSDMIQVSSS